MGLRHSDIQELLLRTIREGLSALLIGDRGVGKTTMVMQAAKESGLADDEVALLSAPLIDPYTDLVGVPVPSTQGEQSVLTWARPAFFYKARMILLDELNRAQPRVVNAVLELFQFRSLSGERLPKLQTVIAAGNEPGEGLYAEPFEWGLVDRADLIIRQLRHGRLSARFVGGRHPGRRGHELSGDRGPRRHALPLPGRRGRHDGRRPGATERPSPGALAVAPGGGRER